MSPRGRILIVDDEANILKTMTICLESLGFGVDALNRPELAIDQATAEHYDIAFVDLKMYPIDGIQLLQEIKRSSPETTVVIITAHGSIDSAVEAIKKGAYDYLQKPFDLDELRLFAEKVWEHHSLEVQVRDLQEQIRELRLGGEIVTRNEAMRRMLDLALQVADSSISVLVEGESGTGKELFAHFIHKNSQRRDAPFIRVNCAALAETLLESELFGHVKGAFTGALKDRIGRFEMADSGSVFLDEIGEISPSLQVKLLRFLQSREFERVGENLTRKVDARVIAATNRNLEEAMKNGTFRDDLYYRLNAVKIKLPPLRERPEDIPLLINHFLKQFSQEFKKGDASAGPTLTPDALGILTRYRWPGNVRQLENALERAVILSRGGTIEPQLLPEEVLSGGSEVSEPLSLEEMERRHIARVLRVSKDLEEAARNLGIDPATLWRKRKKHNL
ncbi:MAG: sigma-54-dependent Fis family transcriptional regulator [Ignavibacteriales bacterium CG07_land_8_20_14_0_80_59_12]|nr:MAG: sigma-54-dependent Fis family transcriptional regulator [Ignavibacteriales bacterium CG07_land_8_20_14_0_80_59_12]